MGSANSKSLPGPIANGPSPDINKLQRGMIRSPSGAEIGVKVQALLPIEKLAEVLKQKSHAKFGINGIVANIFIDNVFPMLPELGQRLFNYFHTNSKAKTEYLGTMAFRQQCERFFSVLSDSLITEIYTKMFANDDRPDLINIEGVKNLLHISFQIAMLHYQGNTKSCPLVDRTLMSVVKSIFFAQDTLSIGFVCRWFDQNVLRLVHIIHKYCLHTLSVAYRGLDHLQHAFVVELTTPVLEKQSSYEGQDEDKLLMPLSQAWLLAGSLPVLYSKPQIISPPKGNSSCAAKEVLKSELSLIPSHWTLLYNSNLHGTGSNRFLHHVLGYRGPTLVILNTKDDQTYCIAAASEWHETHLYTGSEHSRLIQLLPKFAILEKGAKILYLNTCDRGYPKGLRVGPDPRKPVLAIHEDFDKIDCKGIETLLLSIEVWGCGDKVSRDVQLDIKKWQIKEAERQRTVKLTAADWMDHPDRYLLELGGRQNYNN